MKMLKPLALACTLLGTATLAQAFDLGGALNTLNSPDAKSALSIGKKMVSANREIDETEEISIGQGIAAQILGAYPLVNDPAMQKYVNRVGLWLALQTERPNLPWKFGVIDTDKVNAYSMPGGTVLITRGMYQKLHSESELAGVLGHEISHVLRKHQLKAIQKQMGNEWRAELAQTAATHQNNNASSDAAVKAFSAGTELFTRGLDKDDEYEADRMGVVIAARGGYTPFGLVNVLQTLGAVDPKDSGMALMFKTHPSPAKRLDMLGLAMGDNLNAYADQVSDTGRFPGTQKKK